MLEDTWASVFQFWQTFVSQAFDLLPPTNTIEASIFYSLASAVILVPVMSRIGLGTMLGYLLSGILLGPYGLGVVREVDTIMHFAEFGIVLMMFLIGLELDVGRLWKMQLPVFGGGSLQMALCAAPLAILMHFAGLPAGPAVLAGLALAMSSTAVAVQELESRSMMGNPVGQKSFAILLFQDLASIPLIAVIPVLAATSGATSSGGDTATMSGMIDTLIRAAIALFLMIGVGRFFTVPFLRFTIRSNAKETLTAFSLILTVSGAWLMQAAGLSSAMGGFIAGLLLGSSGFRHQLEAEISTFKQLLLGLFFVTVGMSIDMNLVISEPMKLLLATVILLLVKVVMLFGVSFAMGLKGLANKLNFAVVLSQGGEFAFVVFSLAKQQGVLPESWAAILTVAVAFSMGTTPILMQLLFRFLQKRVNRRKANAADDREALEAAPNHSVIIAGYGDFGAVVSRMLVAMGVTPTIIDNDPDRIRRAKTFGTDVFYGDASQLALLEAAGASEAKILVVSVGPGKTASKIASIAREAFPKLHVMVQTSSAEDHLSFLSKDIESYFVDFEPALQASRDCLQKLGLLSPYEAREIADIFRRHTAQTVRALIRAGNNPEQVIAAYRASDASFESVMTQIRNYRRERFASIKSRLQGAVSPAASPVSIAETPTSGEENSAPQTHIPEKVPEHESDRLHSMREDARAIWEEQKDLPPEGCPEPPSPEPVLKPDSAALQAKNDAVRAVEKEAASCPPPNPEELTVSNYFSIYGNAKKVSSSEEEKTKDENAG